MRNSYLTEFFLIMVHRNRPEDDKFVFDNGVVLSAGQCKPTFGPWMSAITDFSQSLHSMNIDISAFACLSALTLVTGACYYIIVVISTSNSPKTKYFLEKQRDSDCESRKKWSFSK